MQPLRALRTWPVSLALAAALLLTLAAACGEESPTATQRPDSPASPTATTAPAPQNTQAPAPTDSTDSAAQAQDSPSQERQPTVEPTVAPTADAGTGAVQATPTAAPSTTEPAAGETDSGAAAYQPYREGEELNVILATTVLEPGPQRIAFLLTTGTGLVKDSEVAFTPVYLPDDAPGEETGTRFNEWPYGTRGTFAAEVDFDRAGTWRLDIAAAGPDATGWGMVEVEVADASPVPGLGTIAPLSENKTLGQYGDIALVTTDYSPDLALYELTIREAAQNPRPSVVVFASPAFCTTPTCGPQVDTVSELREKYTGQANFIHVEIYDNPDEIQGDLSRARFAPTVDEWGLTQIPHFLNESWTFVLDTEGRILDRFEGFATLIELEESLQGALN